MKALKRSPDFIGVAHKFAPCISLWTERGAARHAKIPETETAWMSLPAAERDRIGLIAVDMVFQGFIFGDAYVACGQHEDRAVQDEAIRETAGIAEDRLLNELHAAIEAALPELFGPDGENPAWCDNPGPRPVKPEVADVLA